MIAINQLLLTFLLNAGWQIVLIAGVATVGDLLLRNTSPRYRHLLWVATLGLALTVPTLTSVWLLRDNFVSSALPAAVVERQGLELVDSTAMTGSEASPTTPFVRLGMTMALALGAAYLLIVLYRSLRLFFAWRRTRALARSGYNVPLSDVIADALSKCRSSIDVHNVSILFSSTVRGPVTMGTTRPLIILPEKLLVETDVSLLVSSIGHEMVHISRRDYFFNFIFELIILPLSFHPAAMLVRRRINQTRELCCDERVAGRLLEADEYARSLVRLAGAAANFGSPALTTTVGMGDADNLEVRVMSLLQQSVTGPSRKNYLVFAGLLFVVFAGIAIGGFGFKVGISEVSAQQIEKQDKIGYAVSQDGEEVRKLKQMIELRQKELSQATEENTVRSLNADIAKLKAELMARTGVGIKKESDSTEKEQRFVEEYKAKLAAEEPNLTEDQAKERITKALVERRSHTLEMTGDKVLTKSAGEPGREAEIQEILRVRGEAEKAAQAATRTQISDERDHGLRVTSKPRPTALGCEGAGGKSIARVTFQNDGTIGEIAWVETSSCTVFNESVLQVIRKIEFEPEIKDGQAITVTKQVEYVWAKY